MKRLLPFLLFTGSSFVLYLVLTSFQNKSLKSTSEVEKVAKGCINCHSNSKLTTGPSLRNIRQRRSLEWIVKFTNFPAKFAKENKEAAKCIERYPPTVMPLYPDL